MTQYLLFSKTLSRRPGVPPSSSQFRGVPGNAVKVPLLYLPTVPGIPRSCDTSRAGSAGTSGSGVRVDVWGWENRDTHGGPEQYRPITTGNNFIFTEKPMSKVIKAIHETVVNGKMPSKAIASAIGKPYTTLMRETNPYDPRAKLGVETFMAIIQATGDAGPLELMVQELGYVLQSRK